MGKLIFGKLQSNLMQKKIPYRIILPFDYDLTENDFPVLYLLHGLFGSCDNWLELTKILEYAESLPVIIVLVEGGNGWYSDSATELSEKFESYLIDELFSEIALKFRVDKRKKKAAIAGLSMGGYGSFKFALKRPDLFCFAGSMSGAFIAPKLTFNNQEKIWNDLLPSIDSVFGEENSLTRQNNDIFQLLDEYPSEKINELPYFYFDCGLKDVFLKVNRDFAKLLKMREIPFEYHDVQGGHDWNYWDQQIKIILSRVKDYLVIQN